MDASSYVVKAEFEGALRRLTLEKKQGGRMAALAFSFAQLEGRVRDLFQLPAGTEIALTYVDRDGDIVTMADDQDLQDAFVMQSLNPLRLTVARAAGETKAESAPAGKDETSAGAPTAMAEEKSAPASVVQAAPASEAMLAKETEKNSTGGKDKKDVDENSSGEKGKMDVDAEENDSDKYKDVHYGIRCDNCNMLPILGTRFKSCSKANYDLCRPCFVSTGAEPNDYVTIDRQFYRLLEPTFFGRRMRNPRNLGWRMGMRPARQPTCGNNVETPAEAKKDGAGAVPVEHPGVQCDECGVTPIQGPRFKSSTRFNYDVCLPCFEKGGSNAQEYTRYNQPVVYGGHPAWPPMGRMFGYVPGFVAMPRCGRRIVVHVANGDVEKADTENKTAGAPTSGEESEQVAKNVNPTPPAAPAADSEMADAKPFATGTEDGSATAAAAQAKAAATEATATGAAVTSAPEDNLNSLEALVVKLAGMGFTDDSLNRELLERNNLDLRKTLDELFAAEEWDPILGDLQEMGFYDEQMNRRLLIKNNGSMKRVVRDLVQMDKDKKQA